MTMPVKHSDINVGDSKSVVIFDNLTRTQIVMYAGASGDYNPLHSDEIFTTKVAGYPSVFAHGMLSMGATGRVLTDWFGADGLAKYGVRFVNQVWPGDTLTATATVDAIREEDGRPVADLVVETVNQDGKPVVTGTATARLEG
jgi:acyl dehydratase